MDELVRILNASAELESDGPVFEITNTSRFIRVKALTRGVFGNPEDAFAAARELTDSLLAGDYVAVNINEIGARTAQFEHAGEWRGSVDLALWNENGLSDYHQPALGLS
jgi:hypothetical protein